MTDSLHAVRLEHVERTRGLRANARVELRPLCAADEAMYCGLYTDAETMALIGPPLSPELAARSFRMALRRTADPADSLHFYAIVEKTTQASVGICGQQPMDAVGRRAEIGIMLSPQARVKGYSPEAFVIMLDVTFAALPIDTVWVQYHAGNTAADRLCDRLGFEPYADGMGDANREDIVRCIHRSTWHRTDMDNNTRSY